MIACSKQDTEQNCSPYFCFCPPESNEHHHQIINFYSSIKKNHRTKLFFFKVVLGRSARRLVISSDFAGGAFAITCYQCTDCSKVSDSTKTLSTCSACDINKVYVSNSLKSVNRGCHILAPTCRHFKAASDATKAVTKSTTGSYIDVSCCTTDKCNGASGITSTPFVFLSVGLIFSRVLLM